MGNEISKHSKRANLTNLLTHHANNNVDIVDDQDAQPLINRTQKKHNGSRNQSRHRGSTAIVMRPSTPHPRGESKAQTQLQTQSTNMSGERESDVDGEPPQAFTKRHRHRRRVPSNPFADKYAISDTNCSPGATTEPSQHPGEAASSSIPGSTAPMPNISSLSLTTSSSDLLFPTPPTPPKSFPLPDPPSTNPTATAPTTAPPTYPSPPLLLFPLTPSPTTPATFHNRFIALLARNGAQHPFLSAVAPVLRAMRPVAIWVVLLPREEGKGAQGVAPAGVVCILGAEGTGGLSGMGGREKGSGEGFVGKDWAGLVSQGRGESDGKGKVGAESGAAARTGAGTGERDGNTAKPTLKEKMGFGIPGGWRSTTPRSNSKSMQQLSIEGRLKSETFIFSRPDWVTTGRMEVERFVSFCQDDGVLEEGVGLYSARHQILTSEELGVRDVNEKGRERTGDAGSGLSLLEVSDAEDEGKREVDDVDWPVQLLALTHNLWIDVLDQRDDLVARGGVEWLTRELGTQIGGRRGRVLNEIEWAGWRAVFDLMG
ncbi:hypothetical protein K402DRAFT_456639 [Aulographum hederae CBS 113979]|uniref:Uncharacterized protein n=1 Tax=Aulographum hederae CBS 113979 TaxID=1176131 RepID=A0A6G1GRT3_9PEZI|nr:hypothetical protein K402DRAFT_456639 [Aulographum hederae CBS 113979]